MWCGKGRGGVIEFFGEFWTCHEHTFFVCHAFMSENTRVHDTCVAVLDSKPPINGPYFVELSAQAGHKNSRVQILPHLEHLCGCRDLHNLLCRKTLDVL